MMKLPVIFTWLCIQIRLSIEAGTGTIHFLTYNHTHTDKDCGLGGWDGCDPYLDICVGFRRWGEHCQYADIKTRTYDNTHNFTFGDTLGSSHKNPLIFSVLGNFSLGIRAYDSDYIYDDFLGAVVETLNDFSPNGSVVHPVTETFSNSRISITFNYTLICDVHYYGDCSIYCKEDIDYTCDPEGNKVNRTETERSDINNDVSGCVGNNCTNNATCVTGSLPYICICSPGFTGIYCETRISVTTPQAPISTISLASTPVFPSENTLKSHPQQQPFKTTIAASNTELSTSNIVTATPTSNETTFSTTTVTNCNSQSSNCGAIEFLQTVVSEITLSTETSSSYTTKSPTKEILTRKNGTQVNSSSKSVTFKTTNTRSAQNINPSKFLDTTIAPVILKTGTTPEIVIQSSITDPFMGAKITETKIDTTATTKIIGSTSYRGPSRPLNFTVSTKTFTTETTPEIKITPSIKEPFMSEKTTETNTTATIKNIASASTVYTSRPSDLTVSTGSFTPESTPELKIASSSKEPYIRDIITETKKDTPTTTTKNIKSASHIDTSRSSDLTVSTESFAAESTPELKIASIPILSSHINPLSSVDETLKTTTYQTETILKRPVKKHLTGKKVKVAQTDTTATSITTNFTNSLTNIHPSTSSKAHNRPSKSSNTTTLSRRTSQHPSTTTPSIILVPPTIRNGIAVTTDISSSKNSSSTTSNPTAGTSIPLIIAAILASGGIVLLFVVCGILALRRRRNERKERTLLDNGRDKRGGYHQIKMSDLSEND